MNDFWTDWLEAVRFTCEAQSVISARLMLFASGTPDEVVEEATAMVTEKFVAFAKAGKAAEEALENGLGLYTAAERAYSPLRQCVHANSDRLAAGAH
jgi:hypothetical protein